MSTRAKHKKRSSRRRKPSAALVPHAIPPEPPPVMAANDERGRRRAYVRAPVAAETVEAVERFVDAFGGLFGAIERELRRVRR